MPVGDVAHDATSRAADKQTRTDTTTDTMSDNKDRLYRQENQQKC